ncbi:hypothetical protein HMPREF0294_2367 [Corynebacterium glucuronolyticum ATCC 51867]|nr:hypothetical protein HMPREF0294_2367 [Corynebacterium glucuronolyticum ATCC 51867]
MEVSHAPSRKWEGGDKPKPTEGESVRLIRAIVTFLVSMALVFGLFMLVKWVTGSAMSLSYWDVAAIGVVVIVLEAARGMRDSRKRGT